MAYDHRNKAGNRGDLWKHVALSEVVAYLCQTSDDPVLSYADTHCGRPRYDLSQDPSQARTGIGLFWDAADELPDCAFKQAALNPDRASTREYLGSVLLSQEVARLHGKQLAPQAWDQDAQVVQEFAPTALAGVSQGDGFEGGRASLLADPPPRLIFVDPPYKDAQDWVRIRALLAEVPSETVALVWYPLYWPTKPAHLAWQDAANEVFQIQWSDFGLKPSQDLKGCGVLLKNGGAFAPQLRTVLAAVARAVNAGADAQSSRTDSFRVTWWGDGGARSQRERA